MSKVLGSIVQLIGVVVVNVVKGLNPIVGAAILIGSAVLGGIISSLDHGPRADTNDKPPQTEGTIKVPTPARWSGYGRNRAFEAYSLFTTAANGTAIDVGVYHDGRVDGIERYYLGDKVVTIDGSGWVQPGTDGQYGTNKIQIGIRLGEDTETAFSEIIALVPDKWTADHRGDGCATGFATFQSVKVADFSKVYPSGGPDSTPLSLAMRLQRCFDWRDPGQSVGNPATWKWTENAILHTAHYLLVRDNKDWALHFAPTLDYWTTAADICDEAIPLAGVQTILMAAANHGATSITIDSANGLAVGMTIAVSATGDTSLLETRTVTSLSGSGGAFAVGFSGGLSNDHPQGSQVTWSSGGTPATEARYRSCVAHKHTDPHKTVKASLLACCDGWLSPRADGALVVYAGKYVEPTGEPLGPDDIISYSLQDGVDEENALNQLAVSYVSSNHDFNVVDTDPWSDDDDIASRGKVLADTLANQVPSHSQARRLAKRRISQMMAPKRGTTSTNAAGRVKVIGKRYVRQQLIDAGTTFLDAVVEVTKLTRNLATGGVTFEWILADPNIDAWSPATEEGQPAPVGNRVAIAPLDAPAINSAGADFSAVADGGTGVRLTVDVSGPSRTDLQWYVRWRVHGAVSWNEQEYVDTDPGPSVVLETAYVPTKSLVDVEVAYGTGDGRISVYSSPTTVDTSTSSTPPDAADAITLASWIDALRLTTGRIARASTYRWRFYASDGTTLIRTITTTTPEVAYTSAQAATDGPLRDYIVTVAGVNGAGAGTEATTATLTLAAPSAVTGVSATGGTGEATVTFSPSSDPAAIGYLVATSTASGFDPSTQGTGSLFAGSPAYLQNWAAGTYYTKVAAFDAWTTLPSLLNFSTETSFTTTGSSGGTGGGSGDGGGGYCVTVDTPILTPDGSSRPAGELQIGDLVRTQHETTFEWGDFPVEAIMIKRMPVLAADLGAARMRATADHAVWLGGDWVKFSAIGTPDGEADVAFITVSDAHTYVSNGVLSHNIRWKGAD